MPVATLSGIPCSIRAGETVRFTYGDSSHPASAWTLAMTFRSVASALTVNGAADGNSFTVVLTAADSATLGPGRVTVVPMFTNIADSERESGPSRIVTVLPDLTNTTTGPMRLAYEAALASLNALSARQFSSVSVEGESYTAQDLGALESRVDRMRMDAMNEDRERGLSTAGGLVRIQTRM